MESMHLVTSCGEKGSEEMVGVRWD